MLMAIHYVAPLQRAINQSGYKYVFPANESRYSQPRIHRINTA